PFRIGMGGWLGDGKQYTSWIGIQDTMSAFQFLVDNDDCRGVFNGTVPEPSRNKEWCRSLGRVLNKSVLANAPRWALRGALGELADNLFLASIRAVPGKLLRAGFRFEEPHIEPAFGWMVKAIDTQDPEIMRHRPARRTGGRRGRGGRIR
ncbi:MAG: NAD dependent epimerase/dehydratase family enzyme, partial [Kiritimatiellia bacterium]